MSTSEPEKPRPSTLERIQAIVRELLDDEDIVLDHDTRPSDVDGWDSLANVSIVFSIEEGLGVQLGDQLMACFATVGELVLRVESAPGAPDH